MYVILCIELCDENNIVFVNLRKFLNSSSNSIKSSVKVNLFPSHTFLGPKAQKGIDKGKKLMRYSRIVYDRLKIHVGSKIDPILIPGSTHSHQLLHVWCMVPQINLHTKRAGPSHFYEQPSTLQAIMINWLVIRLLHEVRLLYLSSTDTRCNYLETFNKV